MIIVMCADQTKFRSSARDYLISGGCTQLFPRYRGFGFLFLCFNNFIGCKQCGARAFRPLVSTTEIMWWNSLAAFRGLAHRSGSWVSAWRLPPAVDLGTLRGRSLPAVPDLGDVLGCFSDGSASSRMNGEMRWKGLISEESQTSAD